MLMKKKTKKMLVDELAVELNHLDKYTQKLQELPDFDKSKEIVLGYLTVDKGASMVNYECKSCGHTEAQPGTYVSSFYRCPSCGNEHIVSGSYTTFNKDNLYVEETPNGFIAVLYNRYINLSYADDWYPHQPTTSCGFGTMFIYDRTVNFIVAGYKLCNSIITMSNTKSTDDTINSLLYSKYDVQGMSATRWEELRNEARELQRKKQRERQERAKKRVVIDSWLEYEATPIDEKKLFDSCNVSISAIYDRNANGIVYRTWCTHCGNHYDSNKPQEACPHCGTIFRKDDGSYAYRDSASFFRVTVENTTLPDNDFLMRLFRIKYSVEKPYGEELQFKKEIVEVQRLYFGSKLRVYGRDEYDNSGNYKKKTTVRDISSRFSDGDGQTYAIQSKDEIVDVIKKSAMARSGLAEAWGLVKEYAAVDRLFATRYIRAWYAFPQIELLVKANIPFITSEYMQNALNEYSAVPQGKNVCEILGISKVALKVAREHNMHKSDAKQFSKLWEAEQSMTYEKFKGIQKEFDVGRFLALSTKYHISFDSILHYMDSVYDHQCIVRREALNVWWDYLNMAHELSMDLSQKSLLYPRSLKKEHDVAVFAYNAMKRSIDAHRFVETAQANKARYAYTREPFFVKIPECPEDIIEEATKQHNCLRSYIERVRDGSTTVAFIRRTESPDDSYVSVEIYDNKLYQVKTAFNNNPDDKELTKFLQYWCDACNIDPNQHI